MAREFEDGERSASDAHRAAEKRPFHRCWRRFTSRCRCACSSACGRSTDARLRAARVEREELTQRRYALLSLRVDPAGLRRDRPVPYASGSPPAGSDRQPISAGALTAAAAAR
jgi:hypothetical protein